MAHDGGKGDQEGGAERGWLRVTGGSAAEEGAEWHEWGWRGEALWPWSDLLISKKIDTFAIVSKKIDIKKVEKISKALGDPYRIRIMEAINKQPDWMQCSAIVEMFNLAQSTVSHHLKQLVDADLLYAEKDGRHAKYKVNCEAFGEYLKYLAPFEG